MRFFVCVLNTLKAADYAFLYNLWFSKLYVDCQEHLHVYTGGQPELMYVSDQKKSFSHMQSIDTVKFTLEQNHSTFTGHHTDLWHK